jgi:hypothetical protein
VKPSLRELPRFKLREHGTPERVERIWRRLSPELGSRPLWTRPQTLWAPAALATVFAAGVFVGARFVHPATIPVASPERPAPIEPAAGLPTPPPAPSGATSARPHVPVAHRGRNTGLVPTSLAPVAKLTPPAPSAAPTTGVPEWERLAESGDFERARVELDARGGFDAVLDKASASELMSLVDIARASGGREHAVSALRRLLSVFRAAPEAPLAAWTLGNLLDQAGDDRGASEAYALYRRLSPGGDFAEDALAREVDTALSQGNLELAARLIAQYENEFPNGRSLEEFRSEFARRSDRTLGNAPEGSPASEPDGAAGPERAESKSRSDEGPAAGKSSPK